MILIVATPILSEFDITNVKMRIKRAPMQSGYYIFGYSPKNLAPLQI